MERPAQIKQHLRMRHGLLHLVSRYFRGATILGIVMAVGAFSTSQAATELPSLTEAQSVNDRTVGIVFHYEDIYRQYINDFSDAFAEETEGPATELRIVPMLGVNHVQTMLDILYLKGVDLGIVHSDVFEYMTRELGYERVYQRINSVVELFSEKIVIIAGEQYRSLDELAGRKVNFRTPGKGSDVTGTILFDTLGIDVEKTRFDKLEALEKVKSGEIDAMVYLIEEPIAEFQALSPADRVRLIEVPRSDALLRLYKEAELDAGDFPELVGQGQSVPTLAVSIIIAAYNWPASAEERYQKSERFITAFVDSLDGLKSGNAAERWQQVEPGSDVPGVPRLSLVDSVLRQQAAASTASESAGQVEGQATLAERLKSSLDQRIAETTEPAELDRLLNQLEGLLDRIE